MSGWNGMMTKPYLYSLFNSLCFFVFSCLVHPLFPTCIALAACSLLQPSAEESFGVSGPEARQDYGRGASGCRGRGNVDLVKGEINAHVEGIN